MRPINNVGRHNQLRDARELGQPLHAFDFRKRRSGSWCDARGRVQRIATLDGQVRALGPDMAMVCDADRALAVGGIMGGADSEVTGGTTSVLLEAAYW